MSSKYEKYVQWVSSQTGQFITRDAVESGAAVSANRAQAMLRRMRKEGHVIVNLSDNPAKGVYEYHGCSAEPITWRDVFRRMSNHAR